MFMHGIVGSNVCSVLPQGVRILLEEGVREDTRAGSALVLPGPVMTVTGSPTQRVLTSPVRDANPFFHMMEAIWMLAGRNDATFLNRYVRDFGSRFAEAGGEMHGAYGHRWRTALGFDQLDAVVETLRRDPASRQCVLQMWDAVPIHVERSRGDNGYYEKNTGSDDLRGSWRDRPCNTHVYLRVRRNHQPRIDAVTPQTPEDGLPVLDITVCCRSNDAIMGAHGANAVHFSVLQEYLAARIGVGIGTMFQLSNNYHAYVRDVDTLGTRSRKLGFDPSDDGMAKSLIDDRYKDGKVRPTPMFNAPLYIDKDVHRFCSWHDNGDHAPVARSMNFWFDTVAVRAARAHLYFRSGDRQLALKMAGDIEAPDWSAACVEWIQRRAR